MARLDENNSAKFWVDQDLEGVSLLRAFFRTLSFAPHVHNELVIAVTEEGAGRCFTRGISDVGAGKSVMVFNPGEPHSGGVADQIGWRYRGLYIGRKILDWVCESMDRAPNAVPYFRDSVVNDPALAHRLLRAHFALEDRDARLVRESHFLSAVVELFERYGDPRPRLTRVGVERGPVHRTIEYLQANFADDVTVEQLAACAAMSPFHFVRSFRKVTGLPPHAFLTQVRLNRARRLIASGEHPSEVALAVGFYDQSHLIKHFKRAYGITPGQYAAALQ